MKPRACLRRYPLFALLGGRRLDEWLQGGVLLDLAAGETLFQQGTPGAWAYLVRRGNVRALRTSADGQEVTVGRFGAGEAFGEYALLPPRHNTATCRAMSDAQVYRLPLAFLQEQLAGLAPVMDHLKSWLRLHEALRFLRQEAFLGFMSAESSMRLVNCFKAVSFTAGCTIQADGLSTDHLFLVQRGEVSQSRADDMQTGPLRRLGPGDCFGAHALLELSGLAVSAAITDVQVQSLARQDFCPQASPQTSGLQTHCNHASPPGVSAWVGQEDASDCGLACLAMIAKSHGLDLPLAVLRAQVVVRQHGLNLGELHEIARGLGLPSRAVRVGPRQLRAIVPPAVVHLTDGHYVVLFTLGENEITLGDPGKGIVTMSPALFERLCSGHLLLFRPTMLS